MISLVYLIKILLSLFIVFKLVFSFEYFGTTLGLVFPPEFEKKIDQQ